MRKWVWLLAVPLVLCLAAISAAATTYTVTDLGTLPGGGGEDEARAINTAGQIVGGSRDANGAEHACLWQNGTVTDLGMLPGGVGSEAWGINDAGQIVGDSGDASGNSHACLWENGTVKDLGMVPGHTASVAQSINDNGQIVGYSADANGNSHACLWENGTVKDLGALPGGGWSWASGINDAGQIVGDSGDASGTPHACLWQSGTVEDLGTLAGYAESFAMAINGAGQVVGYSQDESGNYSRAWLWEDGALTELEALPGNDWSWALGINDVGQIVGFSEGAASEDACLWQSGTVVDLGTLPGGSDSWAYAINGAGQIVGCSLWANGWTACVWQPAGPPIDSFTLTPSTLSSASPVTATVTTSAGVTKVVLGVGGLAVPLPDTSMTWNGSAWTAPIPTSLVALAGDSLTVTATAYDSAGQSAAATRTLAVDHGTPPPGESGDPNSLWVEAGNGLGIFVGADTIQGLGPPLSARLSLDTSVTTLTGQDESMTLWPKVTRSPSSGVTIAPASGASVGAVLAQFDRCSPAGGPSYDATFSAVGDTATFSLSMDTRAYGLSLFETLVNAVGVLYPESNLGDLALVDPGALLDAYDAFTTLSPVTDAMAELSPPLPGWKLPLAVAAAAKDLSRLLGDPYLPQLANIVATLVQREGGDASFLTGYSGLAEAIGPALAFDQLLDLCRDWWVWALATWNGNPSLTYHAWRSGAGSVSVSPSARLWARMKAAGGAGSVFGGAGFGARVVRATNLRSPGPSTSGRRRLVALLRQGSAGRQNLRHDTELTSATGLSVAFDVTDANPGAAYQFTVTNDALAPVWEFRVELSPSAPKPTALASPPGWQSEIVWTEAEHAARWYTEGSSGWTSGDFGTATIAPGATLAGFGLTLASRVDGCAYSTMDTDLHLEAGLLAMQPSLVAAPLSLTPGTADTVHLTAFVDRPATASLAIYQDGTSFRVLQPAASVPVGDFTVVWDGRDASGQSAPAGDYEARLAITYADGSEATVAGSIVVALPAPVAAFQAAPTAGLAPLAVAFTDASTHSPTAWSWTFGDGGASSEENPSHTYTAVGQYTVSLTVTSPSGTSTLTQPALISAGSAPTVDFTAAPRQGLAPLAVSFTYHTPVSPTWSAVTACAWNFGDGGASGETSPTHTYAKPGLYSVSLTLTNAFGANTGSKPQYILVSFPDVPVQPAFWALNQILTCVNAGIVSGYPDGSYHPEYEVTRDQMAVYISRALAGGDAKVPTGPATATFTDVPTDYWAFKYVEYAKSKGIVSGYTPTLYAPTLPVTRDQMAVFVARSIVNPAGDGGLAAYTPPAIPDFPDVPAGNWAYKYIEYIKGQSITGGYPDGLYHPELVVTRDQMAVYVARAFGLPM